jgi:hypothetical protein
LPPSHNFLPFKPSTIAKLSSFQIPIAGDRKININEPPPSDKIDADELHPSEDSMALAIIKPKELTVVSSKELTVTLPKEIMHVPKPQAFYARTIPCITLALPPPRFTVEGKLGEPKVLTFCVPKELNLLLPRPDEMLTGLKTNKFGDVTYMKYKKTTPRVTLDGVRAMLEQNYFYMSLWNLYLS